MPTFYDSSLCRGVDLLTLLQGRTFSLFGLMEASLGPLSTNVLVWLIYGFAGYQLMKKWTEIQGYTEQVGWLTAFTWVSGSFFSLRFFSGEVGFAGLLLLPGIFLWTSLVRSPGFYIGVFLVVSELILEGSFQVLQLMIYSILFFILFDLIPLKTVKETWSFVRSRPQPFGFGFLGLICLLIFKLYPWMQMTSDQMPMLESVQLSWQQVLYSFFSPLQSAEALKNLAPQIAHPYLKEFALSFVEIGCFFGAVKLILVFLALRDHSQWRNFLFFFICVFWTAWGSFGELNFWSFHQNLPIQFLHFQTRFLIVGYFVFLCLFAMGLSRVRNKSVLLLFTAFFLFEGAVTWVWSAKNLKNGVQVLLAPHQRKDFSELFQKQDATVKEMDVCFTSWSPVIQKSDDQKEKQKPVVSILEKSVQGQVSLESETVAGEPRLSVQVDRAANIELNWNYALGWLADGAEVYPQKNGRIGLFFKDAFQGVVQLRYQPSYRLWIYFIWILGMIFVGRSLYLFSTLKNEK